jgi:hypothetical protein
MRTKLKSVLPQLRDFAPGQTLRSVERAPALADEGRSQKHGSRKTVLTQDREGVSQDILVTVVERYNGQLSMLWLLAF